MSVYGVGIDRAMVLPFVNLLDSNSQDMLVDGSSTAVDFKAVVPVGKVCEVHRVFIQLVCTAPKIAEFGGGIALTTGIGVTAHNSVDGELVDFLPGGGIKQNYDFYRLSGSDAVIQLSTGDDLIPIRWTLWKSFGEATVLGPGSYLQFKIQDNLTTTPDAAFFQAQLKGRDISRAQPNV